MSEITQIAVTPELKAMLDAAVDLRAARMIHDDAVRHGIKVETTSMAWAASVQGVGWAKRIDDSHHTDNAQGLLELETALGGHMSFDDALRIWKAFDPERKERVRAAIQAYRGKKATT